MRLDEACSYVVDCEHKTAPIDEAGAYFAVGTPAMRDHRIDYAEARRISRETFDAWTRRLSPKPGDLLLAREAPVGPIVRLPEAANVAPGQRTVLLRPDLSVASSNFLYYLLRSPRMQSELLVKAEGSTVHHLNVADIRALEVDLPPLPEQQAIAEVLGALDDKIAANTRLAATAEALAVAHIGQIETRVPLGDLAKLHKQQMNPGAGGPRVVAHHSLPAFDEHVLPSMDSAHDIKSNKFVFDEPVVLLSKLNPRFPRVWRADPSQEHESVASTEFLVLRPEVISRNLLWAAISQSDVSAALDSKVAGTSGSHQRVKPADALATAVRDVRRASSAVSASVDAALTMASGVRYENRTLAATRDALLPKLMSGQLRVKNAEKILSEGGACDAAPQRLLPDY